MEEKIRLQKLMSQLGLCSRRKAEELISLGLVKVDGTIVTEMGYLVSPSSKVEIEGYTSQVSNELVTFLFNKPLGVVSSAKDDRGRKTVIDFFKDENYRLYPVGRLDYNTSGAILVSNDGELTNLVTHPSSHLNKTYMATIDGKVKKEDIVSLERGIKLDDGMTQPAEVKVFKETEKYTMVQITIHEGRNRQVRRMFEHFSYHVRNLNRDSIDTLSLRGLKRGEYRKLSQEEVDLIKEKCLRNKQNNQIPEYKRK